MNAKVVKPIRYQENDVADITRSCWFYNLDNQSFNAQYSIGYPSDAFPSLIMTVDNITDKNIFSKEVILKISNLFIEQWNPYMLCVTDRKYFLDISKASELHTPWTGWFTYLSEDIKQLPKDLDFKIEDYFRGKIIWTTDEYFSVENNLHVQNALALENLFYKNSVLI